MSPTRSGSAYVFRYNGAAWVEEAKLTASDAAAEALFGASVAVADETAVVGAFGNDDNGSLSGSAYIFRYNGAAWVEEAKLTASDGAAGDYFGSSVAVSGDTTLVGAFLAEDNGRGSAYVFVPDPATLALQLAAMATLAALARRTRRHSRGPRGRARVTCPLTGRKPILHHVLSRWNCVAALEEGHSEAGVGNRRASEILS